MRSKRQKAATNMKSKDGDPSKMKTKLRSRRWRADSTLKTMVKETIAWSIAKSMVAMYQMNRCKMGNVQHKLESNKSRYQCIVKDLKHTQKVAMGNMIS